MSGPFQLEAEAAEELDHAARWYENQRAGLGLEFLDAIDTALGQIARFPRAGSPVPDLSVDLPVRRVPAPWTQQARSESSQFLMIDANPDIGLREPPSNPFFGTEVRIRWVHCPSDG